MNKILLKTSIFSVAAIGLFAIANIALADTVTGHLSTAISGANGNNMTGIVIASPVASPSAGTYDSAQSVTLTASGATSIYYTTDGVTIPTCSTGNLYSSPISVGSSLEIQAISCYPNNASSTVASYLYAINQAAAGGGTNYSAASNYGGGGGGSSGGASLFSKGDSNLDGHVNILDFVVLMANWGKTGSGNAADFNGDGKVDIQDFVILMANWTN